MDIPGQSIPFEISDVLFRPQTSGNTSRFIGSLGAQLTLDAIEEEERESGDEDEL